MNETKRILIADNDPSFLKEVKDWLEKANFVVTTAANGKDALDILNKEDFDAILLDTTMTPVSGVEVLQRIKQVGRTRNIPVFMLAQVSEPEGAMRVRELGAVGYYIKSKSNLGDLTDKIINSRKLEEESQAGRHGLANIITSMGEGVLVIDHDFKIVLVNPVAQKILNVFSSDLLGRDLRETLLIFKGKEDPASPERPITSAIQSGEVVDIELTDNFYCLSVSGRLFPIAISIAPFWSDRIAGAVMIFRDISEEQKLEEARNSFISLASHQLRAPLTSIRWFMEMLLAGDVGKLTQAQEEYANHAYEGAGHMVKLIRKLLQIARVEAGRLTVEPTPTDLKHLTEDVLAELGSSLETKNQTVEIKTEPQAPPLVSLDPTIAWEVIENLLSNANHYSHPDDNILVRIVYGEKFVEYSVQDHGIGVPAADQGRIFEKFFRAKNAIKMVPEGTGLGLPLVKILVAIWGGKVWFESTEGKGSTFFFTIPAEGMKARTGEVKLKA